MSVGLLLAPLLLAGPAEPPPFTAEQRDRIHALVRTTQDESARLKKLLDERQRELADVYARYELDEAAAERLEKEIVELQRQTLASYRAMQVELRKIVGKDRFLMLKQRLDHIVGPAATAKDSAKGRPAEKK